MLLPNENSKQIQEILNDDRFTIRQKSYQIENVYKKDIPRNRNPQGKQRQPAMDHMQIFNELRKRGDNLKPIDIELPE
jgi:hypothetical protein